MDVALEKHQTQIGPLPKSVWWIIEWANWSEFFCGKNIGILWPFDIGFEKLWPFGEEWHEIQKKCPKMQKSTFCDLANFEIFLKNSSTLGHHKIQNAEPRSTNDACLLS